MPGPGRAPCQTGTMDELHNRRAPAIPVEVVDEHLEALQADLDAA